MPIVTGTSGYSYKEWKGAFYPADLKADEMLAFYSARLDTVEINNTFYRMPRREVIERWAASVPAGFLFSIKASRRITHMKRLRDVGEPLGFLKSAADALGDKLGAVLFQLPPNFKMDLDRLRTFLDELPEQWPAVMEFRHPSWNDETVLAALDEAGVGLCSTDSDDDAPQLHEVGRLGYVRLRGDSYSNDELAAWAVRLRALRFDRVLAYFKHEESGPDLAARLEQACKAG